MEFLNEFKRISFRHKNNKPLYYVRNYIRQLIPVFIYRLKLKRKLKIFECLDETEKEYILNRVNYYNNLNNHNLPDKSPQISNLKLSKKYKVYFFDAFEFVRYFPTKLCAFFVFGDVTYVPEYPSFVKSRPIYGDNTNSVILKLEKIRHFLFLRDQKKFISKKNMIISRGKAINKPHRLRFLEKYYNHPMCDVGQVDRVENPIFPAKRKTLQEHLDFKFIMCLEGNDVASNLKWVMSSNSLAVMPLPKFETWFMEGTLIPDFHYVLINDDYSNLEERMNFYITHPDEAQKIIDNAHKYVYQFKDKKREDLISLMVLQKYFENTGQTIGY